jgi:hypothetical protein
MQVDLRAAPFGDDRVRSLEGMTVAAGLYALVMALSFAPDLLPVPGLGAVLEPGGVLAGVALAGWWAYRCARVRRRRRDSMGPAPHRRVIRAYCGLSQSVVVRMTACATRSPRW